MAPLLLLLPLFYLLVPGAATTAGKAAGSVLSPIIGVYGSTVCAVSACVAAARMNVTCAMVEPQAHLFGMTAGGLSAVDLRMPLGGIAAEIFYGSGPHTTFPKYPPHVLNATLWRLLAPGIASGAISIVSQAGNITSVARSGLGIASVAFYSGVSLAARIFLDCSYEGDLLRLSNTTFVVGREAASEFN